jgi:hypothetical protein
MLGSQIGGALGFAKRAPETVYDIGNLARRVLSLGHLRPIEKPDWMLPKDDAQRMGGRAFDVATVALPIARAASASHFLPRAANALERHAVPALTRQGAEQVLERGAGIVSKRSASKMAAAAEASPSASRTVVVEGGKRLPIGPSRLQPAADAMARAAARKPKSFLPDVGLVAGGGLLGGPTGAAMGALRILSRPTPSSMIAQGLHSAGPAVQGVAGGVGAMGLQALLRLLGGGSE